MNLINRAAVKKFALEVASVHRGAQGFNRVSAKFLDAIGIHVRALVVSKVKAHPSRGKTLMDA